MLLATVLDSFCISNNTDICGKPVTFGRTMGYWTVATQDGPQYLIHLLFIFVLHSGIDHAGATVIMSLVVSTFAIQISVFNCIMCAPNEFDPMVVKLEFKVREEVDTMTSRLISKFKESLNID